MSKIVLEMLQYSDNDFIFDTSWNSLSVQSKFDQKLKSLWQKKEDEGLFRYKYKVESKKKLPGKYGFPTVVSVLFQCFVFNHTYCILIIFIKYTNIPSVEHR